MTTQTMNLLKDAIEAHGGVERWQRYNGVAVTLVTAGGLWDLKGANMLRTPRRFKSEFRRQWTRETPFGAPGLSLTWTPKHAEIVGSGHWR